MFSAYDLVLLPDPATDGRAPCNVTNQICKLGRLCRFGIEKPISPKLLENAL